ncbi:hypothetical protein [Streptomyces fradiae]|uniref:hypothetical protein n=1 Tax=Streptomyces fradiae TaxID=1906 RepID=UPI0035BE264E
MAKWRRSLAQGFWALDRVMGGEEVPTRLQRQVARHPIAAGFCVAAPFAVLFLLLSPEVGPGEFLIAALFGLLLWLVFGLTAAAERLRLRQRRLRRLGIWDGS